MNENMKREMIERLDNEELDLPGYKDYIEEHFEAAVDVAANGGSIHDLDCIVELERILGIKVSYQLFNYIDNRYENLLEITDNEKENLERLCWSYAFDEEYDTKVELSETVIDTLENLDWSVGKIEYRNYYDYYAVEISKYTPADGDYCIEISFDGTDSDFIRKVCSESEDFEVDEYVKLYINHIGENGVPNTVQGLLDDAKAVQDMLEELAIALRANER